MELNSAILLANDIWSLVLGLQLAVIAGSMTFFYNLDMEKSDDVDRTRSVSA